MKMGNRKKGGGGGPSLTVFERVLRRHIESCKTKHATLDDVVGYLRSTFPEYGRHKLQPFTKSVQRTLQLMKSNNNLRSSSQCRPFTSGLVIDNGEDYEMDDQQSARKKMKRVNASEERLQRLEDQNIQRNRKSIDKSTSSSSESNSTEETDGAVSTSEDSVYGEEFEPEFDLMKSMLRASYSDSKAASKLKKKAVEEKDKVEKNVELEEVFRNKVATRKVEPIGGGDVEEEVKGKDGPRFKDLGGMGGVLEELKMEVIVPLFHPQLPRWLGVRPMAGILLHGPPGCGKTKLAHAVANETGVPFYKISATELVSGVSVPMIQQLETTLRSGVVPHAPQLWPPTQVETSRSTVSVNKSVASSRYNSTTSEVKVEEGKGKVKSEDQDNRVPPAVKLARAQEPSSVNRVEGDHLGDARSKVQGEISKEFAAIMATGTLRASEAATLATRRVDQKRTFGIFLRKHIGQHHLFVFIDEIDAIASKRENLQREMERRIVTQLMTCMDESYRFVQPADAEPNAESSNIRPGYVLVIGATNRPDAVDPALRRPGRFDREIVLGVLDENARVEILSVLTRDLRVDGAFDLVKLARSTPGFVGADLTALSNKAGNLAMKRIIDSRKSKLSVELTDGEHTEDWWKLPWLPEEMENLSITMADFEEAAKLVQPSSRREGFSTIPNVKWEDVGGLHLLRQEFDRYIVRRIKYPEDYEGFGVDLETGFLLYGPPGCGKTLIAKAVANEAGANFIHIKGPELLSKYVGESELAVRTIFSRARTCSPCILFFDEVDALTTKRGKEGGWVVERLLNQLLIELDGADQRQGVYVIGATNRPEVMDRAVLRPGRFGKLLFVPLPSPDERGLILKALARKKPIDASVDLIAIGRDEACENLSGADLSALMNEAAMAALEEKLTAQSNSDVTISLTIKKIHFEQA